MTERPNQRGFALLATMAAVVLALMMLGAFFVTHRGYISAARLDDDRTACQDASLALAEAARFFFEKDEGWGRVESNPRNYEVGRGGSALSFRELTSRQASQFPQADELRGARHVLGEVKASGVGFHLAITNNFHNPDAPTDGVAASSCRVRIQTRRGTASDRVEVVFRKKAFSDATLVASKGITIDVGQDSQLKLDSRDPIHNEIRSLEEMNLPRAGKIKFRSDEDNPATLPGMAWAKAQITVGDDDSDAALQRATQVTGGQFVPRAKTDFEVPELDFEAARGGAGRLPPLRLRSGNYYFEEARVRFQGPHGWEEKSVRTFQRNEPKPIVDPLNPGPVTDLHFLKEELPTGTDMSSVTLVGSPGAASHAHQEDNFEVQSGFSVTFYGVTDDGRKTYQPQTDILADRDVVVRESYNAQGRFVPGDFTVRARGNDLVPRFRFVDADGKYNPQKRGYMSVDRHLGIEGVIVGSGRLVAKGNVNLQPNWVAVNTDAENDLAVFAGKDVQISPPSNGGNNEGQRFIFRGLVYATRDFRFLSNVERPDGSIQKYHMDLLINGAVIARNGTLKIDGNRDVRLLYNPKFLDDFLKDRSSAGGVQVEETSWRPI